MSAHISTLVRQRGFALVGVFLAALLAFSGLVGLANVARAQGSIPVSYAEANPRTGYIEGNSCTSLPQSGYISGLSDDSWPGDEGNCSFIAAHYSRDGVDLVLRELRLDGDRVVLIPEIPAKQSADQAHVELSITLAELEKAKASLGESPIKLYYGDSSQFRRIALSLDSSMAASGGAQPDINVDGTAMTGSRLLYLFRELLPDGSVAYVRNVSVDVPRLWKITMRETTTPKTNQISFKQTNDNSTVDRTVQQFDVIYKGSSQTLVKAEVSAAKFDTVKLHASTFANIWDVGSMPALDKHGAQYIDLSREYDPGSYRNNTAWSVIQSPYNAGGGYAQGRYIDGAVPPFFYKVMTTSGSSSSVLNSLSHGNRTYRNALFRRTGIAVPARSSDSRTWADHMFNNGKYCENGACDYSWAREWRDFGNWDNTWHVPIGNHLLNAEIDAPKPVNGSTRYRGDGWLTDPNFVDQTDAANSTWPAVSGIKWEDNITPLESNASGQGSYASFWVQFNGIENEPLRNDNIATWSYFLGRIRLNDQWFSVPFPNMPKKALKPFIASTGCFLPLPRDWRYPDGDTWGKDLDDSAWFPNWVTNATGNRYTEGKFNTDCTTDYTKARARMFTPVDQPQYDAHNHAETEYVSGDIFDTDAGSNFVYSGIGLTEPQMRAINSQSGRALQRTFSPVTLSETPIAVEYGTNAGVKIKVELVNARSQGDLLADGFSRFTSSGKTVSRANRHTPSPRVGPAGQLTNNSISDRSKLDWDMDRDMVNGKETTNKKIPENDRAYRRSGPQTNQWKTLYKVTVTGMMNPQMDLYFHYDYTSKPKWWNEFSLPAERVMVKESQKWRNNDGTFITLPTWRDRSTEGGIEATEVCKANNAEAEWNDKAESVQKCDATIADDMPKPSDPSGNEANIKFDLRDGYVRPKLTTAYNRLQYDVCPDAELQGATAAQHEHRDINGNLVCERKAHNGKTWEFRWNYNNEEPLGFARDSREETKNVRTDTSTSFRVDADVVRVPSIVMTGTGADGAPSKAVTEQWKGNVLAAPTVDKESNYFMKVLGDVPAPITVEEDGQKVKKAFTGYQLYAVNCKEGTNCVDGVDDGVEAKLTRMYADRVFYPGDVVDLRALNPETGDPMIRLSNDEYLGARYDAFWFVPTYGQPLKNTMKLYTGQKYLGTSKNAEGEWEYEPYQDDFKFYAAPGLTAAAADTASDTEGAYLPKSIKLNNVTYTYREDFSDTAKAVTKNADEVLAFRYLPPEIAKLRVNLTWTFLDGANNDAVMEGVVPTQGGVEAWLYLNGGPTRPAKEPDATKNKSYTWNTDYGYSEGDQVQISYDYKVDSLVAPGCELTPVSGTWKRVDKGKEKAEETFLPQDAVGSKLGERIKITPLEAGANTYEVHITARCEQSITVYSEGDHKALSDSGYPMPAEGENDPEHLKPVAGGPEQFTRATAGEKRSSILDAIGGSWKPFHATVTNGILDPHTEPTIESGSKADRHFKFSGVLYRNGEATSTTVPVGVREPAWMQAGKWAPQLANHGEWVYNYVCPLSHGVKNNDDTSVMLAGLEPGQNVVCYVGFHTSEVTVLADVPNGNESNFSALIDEYRDDVTGGKVPRDIDGLGTSVTKATTTRFSPGSPLGLSVGMKTGSTSDYLTPEYYLYTGRNANEATTASTDWKKLATAEEVKRWYPDAATSIKDDTLYELGSETNTVATVKNGVPVAYTPAADTHVVLKVVLTPVVRPSLPLTGGIPADYILLAGLAILAGGGAIAAYTIRRRKRASAE